ncbi:MAG: bifunctional 3,4-dihydroxy-2-butanone-4-phosphate synthase RibB/GTP cyclohydrolase RibA [Cyanobacteriota bacterium]
MVVVVDDENRENEGDLICAAQFATPEQINFMATEARGLICLAMEGERLDALDLPLMVDRNTDSNQTAFTVSVDAGPENGVSTGISAEDRARTIQVAIHPATRPADLRRPGHIFPLRAKQGGVLKRAGHTEAAVDLARLAGLYPAGVICEIQNADGSMSRLPQLVDYARQHGLRLINIADLIRYRLDTERFVRRQAEASLPSAFGQFRAIGYRNELDGSEHVAIVKGQPEQAAGPVLVRVHSECLTGDAFGSLRCDCRPQLEAALRMIEAQGEGVVVYLRQEGRGIGLINKLRAYSLQDGGLDTVEANERLGFPADLRNYGVGAQILSDLGVHRLRLITNNPRKIAGLGGYGLQVEDRVPLVMDPSQHNAGYLQTKQAKLGHLMEPAPAAAGTGPAAVLAWKAQDPEAACNGDGNGDGKGGDGAPGSGLVAQLQELRQWAEEHGLQLEREEHSRVLALLDQPHLAVVVAGGDAERLDQGLRRMAHWQGTQSVSLLLAADAQRTNHPSNTLEAQRRPLVELRADRIAGVDLPLESATLLRWS